jgi:hypothetical protein
MVPSVVSAQLIERAIEAFSVPNSQSYVSAGRHGDVAQSVEHLLCKQGVGGSSPLVSTTKAAGRERVGPYRLLVSPPPPWVGSSVMAVAFSQPSLDSTYSWRCAGPPSRPGVFLEPM